MSSELLFARPTNLTGGPSEFFISHIDAVSGGVWGTTIILLVFGLIYLNLNQFNPRKAFAAASFSSFVVAVMLIPLGVAGNFEFIATLLAVSLAIAINSGGDRL